MQLGKYRHFKGGEYEVIGIGKYESDMSDMVIYKPLYPISDDLGKDFQKNPLFIRTRQNFCEEVNNSHGNTVPRFIYVGE